MTGRSHALAAAALAAAAIAFVQTPARTAAPALQFIFTSDAHYGLTRAAFRGASNVDAHLVNAALVARMNAIGSASFPQDEGVGAGTPVGPVDFVVEGGDVANRAEVTGGRAIQSAAASWAQFTTDYVDGLRLTTATGARARLFVIPGNHNASNAVGFYRPMEPAVDPSAMIAIFNRMAAPAVPRTTATYSYSRDTVVHAEDAGGVHLIFTHVWPDSVQRRWIESDLKLVAPTTPVIVFAHDQPDSESKHFVNPNGAHDVNTTDRFENILADRFADGASIDTPDVAEQAAFEAFVHDHPNVAAYFHGNSNWNEFYDWTGPSHTIALHTFRVDSPMKGAVSASDETRLSFQIATLDGASMRLTVREVLWNADPSQPEAPIRWGASRTVTLGPQPRLRSESPSSPRAASADRSAPCQPVCGR